VQVLSVQTDFYGQPYNKACTQQTQCGRKRMESDRNFTALRKETTSVAALVPFRIRYWSYAYVAGYRQ
jgi:hypothetical protein